MTVISYAPYQYNLSYIQWNTKKVFQLDLHITKLLVLFENKNMKKWTSFSCLALDDTKFD